MSAFSLLTLACSSADNFTVNNSISFTTTLQSDSTQRNFSSHNAFSYQKSQYQVFKCQYCTSKDVCHYLSTSYEFWFTLATQRHKEKIFFPPNIISLILYRVIFILFLFQQCSLKLGLRYWYFILEEWFKSQFFSFPPMYHCILELFSKTHSFMAP